MKRTASICLAVLLVVGGCKEGGSPTSPTNIPTAKQRLMADVEGIGQAGTSFYQVFVSNLPGSGIGAYTVMTGPNHPVTISQGGTMKNVLYGDGNPGTSYQSIHSYASNTTYITAPGASSSGNLVALDPTAAGITATIVPIGTTGFRTTYTLAGPPQTPDKMTIVEVVDTHGTTFETATVEVTTTITNNGAAPLSLGVRYLWDVQIGDDDGPTFQQFAPNAAAIVLEKSFPNPAFQFYRIQDNDGNSPTPLFSVFGTVSGPNTITPAPTPPEVIMNADWLESSTSPFAYTVNPSHDVSTNAGSNDNAVLYYWGSTQGSAITIAPNASRSFSQSLVSAEADAPPPFNQHPTAAITLPANDASFVQGASVGFAGSGSDPEDGPVTGSALRWSSDRDGALTTGATFSRTNLSVGTHVITLTAVDSKGQTGTATVTIHITAPAENQSPTAHITAPTGGSIFTPATSISFAGTGSDAEDGSLSGASLVWTDNVSGQIGTGTSFSTATLAAGVHTVTLTVTDSKGAKGTATVSFTLGYSQAIGAAGGSLCVEACHLSLYIPAGALSSTVTFVEYPVANPQSPPAGIVGSAHVIAPSMTFASSGALGIGYDPGTLPSGMSESSLRIYQLVGSSWQLISNSNVNTSTHIVYAQVGGTGLFAIVGTP